MNRRRYYKRKRRITLFTRVLLVAISIGAITFIYVSASSKKNTKQFDSDAEIRTTELADSAKYDEIMSKPDLYPKKLRRLLKRNIETVDFVYNYPENKNSMPAESVGNIPNGEIPELMQWDERWGYAEYVDNMMAINGCGPTALSMVIVGLTGDTSITPYKVAEYAVENGYYVEGTGTAWNLMSQGCTYFGVRANELPLDENIILEQLENGNPIICSVGPGDFTDTGHFIVLTKVENGKIKVNDPNSKNKSHLWEYERLRWQIRNLWTFEKY